MKKETLKFRGIDTGVEKQNDVLGIVLISLIDYLGKEYYLVLKKEMQTMVYPKRFNKQLEDFFDNYFKTNK